MKTKDDNKKRFVYPTPIGHRTEHLSGIGLLWGEAMRQHAVAIVEGFRWVTSTDTHDVLRNAAFKVRRCINKNTGMFYEASD